MEFLCKTHIGVECLCSSYFQRERMEKLREIRQSYLGAVVGMLIVIYDQSQDSRGAVRLADLLANEKYEIAEVRPIAFIREPFFE